jgi:hypothetical protein
MAIGGDGIWWFYTELPGDESQVGWGPDPQPHVKYDIECNECADSEAFTGGIYKFWSKFYPEALCTLEVCGYPTADHQASKLNVEGQTVYKYDFVLPQAE